MSVNQSWHDMAMQTTAWEKHRNQRRVTDWSAQLEQSQFDEADSEHITISSEPVEEDVTPDKPGQTNRHFSQSSSTRNEKRSCTIFDDRFLAVSIEQPPAVKTEYRFNLAFLDPVPRRYSGVAWRWLYAALTLTGIVAVIFWLMGVSGTPLLEQRWLPAGVLLAVAATIAFLVFVYRTRFTLTFYSLHGKAPLVELDAGNPTRSAVSASRRFNQM